ncbi:MAG: hypothetical protein CMK32_09960 [Porticoccaceae bacterium]|nr:hypothetical protein [Porticoccaceae bacterium]
MAQVVEGGSNGWVEVGGHPDLSMKLVMSRTTRSITRVFMIESPTGVYDEVNAFLAECRPAFSPPGKYPILGVQLYVDTVNIEPYGAVGKDDLGKPVQINGFPSYESFKATVTYTPLPYQPKNPNQPSPDPLLDNLEIVANVGAEAMSLPGSQLYWAGGTKVTNDPTVAASIRIDTIDYQITKHHLRRTDIPWDAIRTINSRVNEAAFSDSHPIFPGVKQESLLFRGAQISIRFSGDGTIENSLTYNFSERTATHDGVDVSWNHLYDSQAGQQKFRKVYKDSANNKPLYSTSTQSEIEAIFDT